MKRKRFSEGQVMGVLKVAEAGANTQELCSKPGGAGGVKAVKLDRLVHPKRIACNELRFGDSASRLELR